MYEGGHCDSGKVEFLGSSTPLKLRELADICPGRLALLDSPTCKKKGVEDSEMVRSWASHGCSLYHVRISYHLLANESSNLYQSIGWSSVVSELSLGTTSWFSLGAVLY